jgi:CRP-like cAMP-binding protein
MQDRKEAALELLFRRIEVRDTLSADEKQAMLNAATDVKSFPVGSNMVREGDMPSVCTMLARGLASRFNITEDGGRQISAVHVAGDFVDLHSFPLKRMDHGIGALTDCDVVLFPHTGLLHITENYPHLTRLLWMLTLLDAAMHRRWLVAMGRKSATSHMAHFVCEIYLRLEAVGRATRLEMDLPLTQTELADVLGISSVHTNRVLQELRGSSLLNWEGARVRILDWPGLQAIAGFSDEYLFQERFPR